MGDLNARTGIVPEFQNFDLNHTAAEIYGIDDDVINFIDNAHELRNNGILLFRKSMDKTKNNFGNQLLQCCKHNNLYICNGRLEQSDIGAFTCIKGSVIDYLISNINGLTRVKDFTVHDYVPTLSDVHSAISFMINIQFIKRKRHQILSTYKK